MRQTLKICFCLAAALNSVSLRADLDPAEELRQLIRTANYSQLEYRLKAGLDPQSRLPDGSLPLAWAAEMQDAQAMGLLLAHGASPDDAGPRANPFRPIIVACQYGEEQVLDLLLDANADVAVTGPDNIPALSLCAGHASSKIVARMINAGALPDETDAKGQTPLMWAAINGRVDNVELLLRLGADANRQTTGGFTPLFFAVKSGRLDVAEAIIAGGGDPTYQTPDSTSVMQLAMYQHNYAFAGAMAKRAIDLSRYDRNGRQLLHAAVIANQPELVDLLLAQGADVNAVTKPSLVKWRYESNFRAGAYEFPIIPSLMLAALQGHSEILSRLADAGADTKFLTPEGDDVLLMAASSGDPETLHVALGLNTDVNAINKRGDTALHKVLANGTGEALVEMLKMLAQHGARADIENSKGMTAKAIAEDEHFKNKDTFAALFNHTKEQGL